MCVDTTLKRKNAKKGTWEPSHSHRPPGFPHVGLKLGRSKPKGNQTCLNRGSSVEPSPNLVETSPELVNPRWPKLDKLPSSPRTNAVKPTRKLAKPKPKAGNTEPKAGRTEPHIETKSKPTSCRSPTEKRGSPEVGQIQPRNWQTSRPNSRKNWPSSPNMGRIRTRLGNSPKSTNSASTFDRRRKLSAKTARLEDSPAKVCRRYHDAWGCKSGPAGDLPATRFAVPKDFA